MATFRRTYKTVQAGPREFRIQKGKWFYGPTFTTFKEAEQNALLYQAHDAQNQIDKIRKILDEADMIPYEYFTDFMC